MKTIGKKMIAGAIAASFVLGGSYAALSHSQAYAADTTTTTSSGAAATQQQGKGPGHMGRGGFGFGGGNLVKEAATVLGQQESDLQASLQSGKTLLDVATAAGLTEDDFIAKLAAAEKTAIDAQVTAGKLTQDQADKIVSGLSDRLKQQIENTGPIGGPGRGGHGGLGFGSPMGNSDLLPGILGMTQDELRTQLDSGTSIADLAAAKGISEDDLISKIKDGMTDSIKTFVEAKHVKPANAPAANPSTGTAATTTNS